MKKIRSYASIWSVEKVRYAINDVNLSFSITFTQMTWFIVALFLVMLLGNLVQNGGSNRARIINCYDPILAIHLFWKKLVQTG